MVYVSAQLDIIKQVGEQPYALLSRFFKALQNIPISYMLQDSEWVDLFLQVYEPNVVHWPKRTKSANMDQMVVWIDIFEDVKSKRQQDGESLHTNNDKVE